MEKRTKIIATVSDQRCEPEFIEKLFKAGMNAVRINSAHVTRESAKVIVDNVRRVSDSIAIIIDTKGPEIRVTKMTEECSAGVKVNKGDKIVIKGTGENLLSNDKIIYFNDDHIAGDVPVGSAILIDDGDIEFIVVEKKDDSLIAQAQSCGIVKSRKSVNIPGVFIDLPSVTEKDKEFILWAIENDLDFIAHSFVRKAEDVLAVKKLIKERNSGIKIISKIENREGVDNIDEIIQHTYGVMVARGDLGVEIPAEQIPVVQRMLVKKCIESKTPVIIATQMLHSMIHSPRPTRAEVTDIANAIYERVDCVMLSGETANGDYPEEAVTTMAKIALEIERDNNNNKPFIDMNIVNINNEITAQLCRSGVRACQNLPIKAIVLDTLSGRTARYMAAFRGAMPVYTICYRKNVVRRLALSYGIHPMHHEPAENPHNFILNNLCVLEEQKRLQKQDLIVIIGGSFGAAKGASYMEISNVLNFQHKAMNL